MAEQVLEGTWEEIACQADRFVGQRVRLTILTGEQAESGPAPNNGSPGGTAVYFGMFKGEVEPTEEDFRSAEFHGDPDDGLDWS